MDIGTCIKKYIEEKIPSLNEKIHPLKTNEIDTVNVVYSVDSVKRGVLNESQLTLRIVGIDYDEVVAVSNDIIELLFMYEETPYIEYNGIHIRTELSGGGILDYEEYYENTLIYIMNWR